MLDAHRILRGIQPSAAGQPLENLSVGEIGCPTSEPHLCLHPHASPTGSGQSRGTCYAEAIQSAPVYLACMYRYLCSRTSESVPPLAVLLCAGFSGAAVGVGIRGRLPPKSVVDCVKGWNTCRQGFLGMKNPSHEFEAEAHCPSIGQTYERHQVLVDRSRQDR
jgi:hypothetical protein